MGAHGDAHDLRREAAPAEVVGRVALHQAGASVLVHPAAPPPTLHRPLRAEEEIAAILRSKVEARERRIEALRIELGKGGAPVERMLAAIIHDVERAPRTTNRRQLAEIGIEVPRCVAELGGEEVSRTLWRVVYGLARLGIFLLGTDHLDDRALLALLAERILEDEVGDVPPTSDMSEFIDLGAGGFDAEGLASASGREAHGGGSRVAEAPAPPDGLLGPFEYAPSVDEESFGRREPRAPPRTDDRRAVGRDALLPRPFRPEVSEG